LFCPKKNLHLYLCAHIVFKNDSHKHVARGNMAGSVSSGFALTPHADMQFFPNDSLRNKNTETFQCFERMRQLCASKKHVAMKMGKSTYSSVCIGEGAESVVFLYTNLATPAVRYAVKFDKDAVWCEARKCIKSVRRIEIDATCAVWEMLPSRGLSPHIARPFGVLPFVFDASMAPFCNGRGIVDGMVMEYMSGLTGIGPTPSAPLLDMNAFIKAGCAGKFADRFDQLLRTIAFQVFYTIAMWNVSTGTAFRHNDLHSGNVCLTYWNEEHTEVEIEYRLPCGRAFVLRTPICATIIDFGNAALLPSVGGSAYDARFYAFAPGEPLIRDAKGRALREVKWHDWGMSHCQPSAHYDCLLFAFALLQLFGRDTSISAAQAYRMFYARSFGNVHVSEKYMLKRELCGRLTTEGQQTLMDGKKVRVNSRTFAVLSPLEVLMDPYFSGLRGVASSRRKYVFGLQPSEAVAPPPLRPEVLVKSISLLAENALEANGRWKPVVTGAGKLTNPPKPGLWAELIGKMNRQLDAARAASSAMPALTPDQLVEWVGESAAAAAASTEAEELDDGEFNYATAMPIQNL
jgi:hypothetical protein